MAETLKYEQKKGFCSIAVKLNLVLTFNMKLFDLMKQVAGKLEF